MGIIEIGALVLTGAGTLGSVLGLFHSYASKENGKLTRAMMKGNDEETRKLILHSDEETRKLILDSDEKTRELIRQGHTLVSGMHEDNKRFHQENKALLEAVIALLKKNGSPG